VEIMRASRKIPVGVQLYSLRTVIPGNVKASFLELGKMGYSGVEFAGYYDLPGDVLRGMLDEAGLKCAGVHAGMGALEGAAFDQTVAMCRALGTDRMTMPYDDMKDLTTTIRRLNEAHRKAKACGMRVGYHNHMQEFGKENGVTFWERIASETPADFALQLDIGWATAAGQDVPALLRKYGPRLETVHVKEYSKTNPQAAVGAGDVVWPGIFDIIEKETPVQWYIVEQEQFEKGPMDSVRTGLKNIREMGR